MDKRLRQYAERLLRMTPAEFDAERRREAARAYEAEGKKILRTDRRLRWLQREYGICSEPECDQPIQGWCSTCDAQGPFRAPKWCEAHLDAHLARHAGHTPYLPYQRRTT